MTNPTKPLDIEALYVFDDIVNDWGIPSTSQRVARVRDALAQLSASQALLEECKTVIEDLKSAADMHSGAQGDGTYNEPDYDRNRAASLIEKLEGMG